MQNEIIQSVYHMDSLRLSCEHGSVLKNKRIISVMVKYDKEGNYAFRKYRPFNTKQKRTTLQIF